MKIYENLIKENYYKIIMIQYRRNDGMVGVIYPGDSCHIEVKDHSFTIVRRIYGYDEYDWVDDKISDVIELRIG